MAISTLAAIKKYRIHSLGPKEASFVISYFENGHVVARAARAVNMTEAQGNRLFKKPEVQEAIRRHQRRMQAKFEISIETVMNELALIGFARMGNYTAENAQGEIEPTLDGCTDEELAAVQSVELEETVDRQGHVTRKLKFKLHDKRAALVDMRKHLGGQYDAKAEKVEESPEAQAKTAAQRIREALRQMDDVTGTPE